MNSSSIEQIALDPSLTGAQNLIERLQIFDQECMDYPWTLQQWERQRAGMVFLLEGEKKLQGFILFQLSPWDRQAHLLKIGIKAEMRGTGAAMALFDEAVYWLRSEKFLEIYLEVSSSNERALGFYKKCRFKTLCVKKSYYSDGKDAFALLLKL